MKLKLAGKKDYLLVVSIIVVSVLPIHGLSPSTTESSNATSTTTSVPTEVMEASGSELVQSVAEKRSIGALFDHLQNFQDIEKLSSMQKNRGSSFNNHLGGRGGSQHSSPSPSPSPPFMSQYGPSSDSDDDYDGSQSPSEDGFYDEGDSGYRSNQLQQHHHDESSDLPKFPSFPPPPEILQTYENDNSQQQQDYTNGPDPGNNEQSKGPQDIGHFDTAFFPEHRGQAKNNIGYRQRGHGNNVKVQTLIPFFPSHGVPTPPLTAPQEYRLPMYSIAGHGHGHGGGDRPSLSAFLGGGGGGKSLGSKAPSRPQPQPMQYNDYGPSLPTISPEFFINNPIGGDDDTSEADERPPPPTVPRAHRTKLPYPSLGHSDVSNTLRGYGYHGQAFAPHQHQQQLTQQHHHHHPGDVTPGYAYEEDKVGYGGLLSQGRPSYPPPVGHYNHQHPRSRIPQSPYATSPQNNFVPSPQESQSGGGSRHLQHQQQQYPSSLQSIDYDTQVQMSNAAAFQALQEVRDTYNNPYMTSSSMSPSTPTPLFNSLGVDMAAGTGYSSPSLLYDGLAGYGIGGSASTLTPFSSGLF